ncbi:MAG: 3'-5' exonuclease, partial [Treponemataceae bacterium]
LQKALTDARSKLENDCEAILAIDEEGIDSLEKAKNLIRPLLPLPTEQSDAELAELTRRASVLSSGELRKPGTVKQHGLLLLKELLTPVKDGAATVLQLSETVRLRSDIEGVGILLDDLARRFLERKRREGVLSFQDAAELAIDILKNDGEIRGYYKQCLKSILIDEFQDNNELQKELLFLLAEREDRLTVGVPKAEDLCSDKLFFVGDEKQSIYRFRGADVSVFRRLSGELDRAVGKPTALSLNFNHRSSAELVAFFNAIFPGVFGLAEKDFEARFSVVDTLKEQNIDEKTTPAVEFHILEPLEGDDDSDDEDISAATAEAFAAASRIVEGVALQEFAFSDIAVLFRSTSRQHEYERAFRVFGVPYQAADPRGLFAEGPANDLYAALRLCLFPQDRNAYAALLRSPFIRLGDESLARVLLDERRDPFPDDAPETWFTSEADAVRYKRGTELCKTIRENADLIAISELISRLWYDEGYHASLLNEGIERGGIDHFEKLYALALDADRRRLPLAAFLDELTPFMGSAAKIEGDEASDVSGNAVRLMTVHKSKGLEFPVVIVADAGNDGRGVRNDQPFYNDPEFGVIVNLRREDSSRKKRIGNWFFDREKENEKERELAELRRLLYVAATRAEWKLFFFGNKKTNASVREDIGDKEGTERQDAFLRMRKRTADGESADPKSFFDLLAEGFSHPAADQARFSVHAIDPKPALTKQTRTGAELRTLLPESFYEQAPSYPFREPARMTTPTALEAARLERNQELSAGTRYAATLAIDPLLAESKIESVFGTLCHLVIERALTSIKGQAALPTEDCALLLPDLRESERADIAATAFSLAQGFLASELGRKAVAATRRRSEFPFLIAVDSGVPEKPYVVNGKMDLLFEIPGNPGRCVIVDFKTDRTIDAVAHLAQMTCYRAASPAFSDMPSESWLFYLRGGIAVPILDNIDLCQWTAFSLKRSSDGDDR